MQKSSSKLILLISSIFIALILSGCGNEQAAQNSASSFAMPKAITQAKIADSASIKAYLQVDGGARQQMTVSNSDASIAITGLSPGSHQFTITFEYSSGSNSGQILVLAQSSHTANINAGANTPLAFVDADFDFNAFDHDDDGISNLDEILTDNARLHDIALSSGSLNETFDPALTQYTASVAYDVTDIQVSAILQNSAASLTINGVETANNTASDAITLNQGSNEITIATTAEDGLTTQSYTLTIIRQDPADNNADLQSLQISTGNLNESFQAAVTSYSANVDYSTSTIQITANPVNSSATLKVNGASTPNNSASNAIPLAVGSNAITVNVTSGDQSSNQDYTINITRAGAPDNDASLQALSLSAGSLNEAFDPAVTSYTVNVAYETAEIQIVANPLNSNASLEVNNVATANNTASSAVALAEGSNTIPVTVTSADATTSQTYTLTITRLGAETSLATADLQSISLSAGVLLNEAFSPTQISYTADVNHATSAIQVTANALNSNATIKVNNAATANNTASAAINLAEGHSNIAIEVTSEDGSTTKVYYLTISRPYTVSATAGANGSISPASQWVSDGNSASFTVTPDTGYSIDSASGCGGSLSGNTYTTGSITAACTVTASFVINAYTVSATAGSNGAISPSNATVDYGNTTSFTVTPDSGYSIDSVTGCSGTLSGSSYSTAAITAACTVNASFKVSTNNATLQSLELSAGSLNPVFDPATTSYSASVANTVSAIQLIANPLNSSASLAVDGVSTTNGVASASIGLYEGSNSITVRVTSQDGTVTRDYVINVIRLAPTSDIANLSGITLNVGDMDQAFQSTQPDYTASVDWLISSLQITTTAQYGAASVSINGATPTASTQTQTIELAEGENLVEIIVTAADDITQRRYTVTVTRALMQSFVQRAYVKASNTGAGDKFGYSVALDGDTLAVGALSEDSPTTTINDNTGIDEGLDSNYGAVYVFTRNAGVWSQQAYIKAPNAGLFDQFGYSIALDGDTLVVGAPFEDGAGNVYSESGAVYVFTRSGGTWSQQDYIKPLNVGANDYFGFSVALEGEFLAVGSIHEDGDENGVDNGEFNDSGAVYIFTRSGMSWSQKAYLKASNPEAGDWFGWSVALDSDTLVVGAYAEDGVDDGTQDGSGAVYVFSRGDGTWPQSEYIKALNAGAGDYFGSSVALSGDTLVVGAPAESGVDDLNVQSGAVYVFTRSGGTWLQQTYLKATNSGPGDWFGHSVALDGHTLAVGAIWEDGEDNGTQSSGAVYVFTYNGGNWSQQAYLNASNSGENDSFGRSIALSGNVLAVGADVEDGPATDVSETPLDDDGTADDSGAVYIFR